MPTNSLLSLINKTNYTILSDTMIDDMVKGLIADNIKSENKFKYNRSNDVHVQHAQDLVKAIPIFRNSNVKLDNLSPNDHNLPTTPMSTKIVDDAIKGKRGKNRLYMFGISILTLQENGRLMEEMDKAIEEQASKITQAQKDSATLLYYLSNNSEFGNLYNLSVENFKVSEILNVSTTSTNQNGKQQQQQSQLPSFDWRDNKELRGGLEDVLKQLGLDDSSSQTPPSSGTSGVGSSGNSSNSNESNSSSSTTTPTSKP